MMSSAIVTIGTEITDGQIVDRNSSWISQKLEALNLNAKIHISVPDDKTLMLSAIKTACEHAEFVFISGGLGPTTDDFTRDVVAEAFNTPLEFNAPTWNNIESKLRQRNVTIREGHRQQALIPKDALVLENSFGVAPGFYVETDQNKVWVLPGPPKEIEAIWNDHINTILTAFSPVSQRKLHTWLTLDIAESEIAHITEEHFKLFSFNKSLGYRLQSPYVEIKLWVDQFGAQEQLAMDQYLEKIKPYFVDYNSTSLYKKFAQFTHRFKTIEIFDAVTDGLLTQKMQEISTKENLNLKKFLIHTLFSHHQIKPKTIEAEMLMITLSSINESQYHIEWHTQDKTVQKTVTVPNKRKGPFVKAYVLERVLIEANSMA